MKKCCLNCLDEYHCSWNDEMICNHWRAEPGAESEMMEAESDGTKAEKSSEK